MTITEVKYYYYRDQHRAPRVTLCRVRDDLGRYGYGWSICTDPSPHPGDRIRNDTLIRGGRSIARGRAEAALSVKRGVPCLMRPDGVINRLYHRPIRRLEAVATIQACHAGSLLQFLSASDVRWLPDPIRPKSVSYTYDQVQFDLRSYPPMVVTSTPEERSQRLQMAIRAGADANELARLEILGAVDAAGYLNVPTVYSEALERFAPESEAL